MKTRGGSRPRLNRRRRRRRWQREPPGRPRPPHTAGAPPVRRGGNGDGGWPSRERDGNRRSGIPTEQERKAQERAARRQKRWQLATGSTGTAAGEGGRRGPRAPGTPPGGGNWHVRPRRPRPAGVGRKERRGQGGSAWVGLFSRVFGGGGWGGDGGLWWGWGICRPDHLMCCALPG